MNRGDNDAPKNDPRIFEPAVHGREQRAGTRKSDWDLVIPCGYGRLGAVVQEGTSPTRPSLPET
jgi:hypothetical protein